MNKRILLTIIAFIYDTLIEMKYIFKRKNISRKEETLNRCKSPLTYFILIKRKHVQNCKTVLTYS